MRDPTQSQDLSSNLQSNLYFHYAFGFTFPMTRAHVRLLGPCYKTGQADHACFRLQFKQCQTTLTDSRYRQRATVTRPQITSTQLVKAVDRDKRLFFINDRINSRRPGLKPQGFAVPQHLNYEISRMQPDDGNKCGVSSATQTAQVRNPRKSSLTCTINSQSQA